MSEGPLGLGGSRREDAEPQRARMLDPIEPERRLPDARAALEHERCGPGLGPADEVTEGRELLLPTDDLDRHPLGGRRGAYVTRTLPCIQGCSPHMK